MLTLKRESTKDGVKCKTPQPGCVSELQRWELGGTVELVNCTVAIHSSLSVFVCTNCNKATYDYNHSSSTPKKENSTKVALKTKCLGKISLQTKRENTTGFWDLLTG